MKKIVFTLICLLASTCFTPANAIPAFARQTGLACSGCHAQPIPVLNAFGRTFKSEGYIRMGAQAKLEGENLSLPQILNASLSFKYGYQKSVGDGTVGQPTSGGGTSAVTATNDGQWKMDDVSLFFGGRIADGDFIRIGFLNQNDLIEGHMAALRVPIVLDAVEVRLSLVPFTTRSQGVQYGFELSSGGVLRANHWSEHRRETSAIQYNAGLGADLGAAIGNAFVLQHDLFFINYTIWSPSFASSANNGSKYGQKYIRVAVTPTIADYQFIAGIGKMSGSSYGGAAKGEIESTQTFFDVQAQGEIAGMAAGLFFQHARAPVCGPNITTSIGATGICAYNGGVVAVINTYGVTERKATTFGADFEVIPHTLSVGVALRKAQNGDAIGINGDDAKTLTATYDLFQNVALHFDYSSYSGSSHNLANAQKSLLTLMLEAAW